jgi:hypothetical protein
MSTINDYTMSFVMEEQAVFPRPGERSPQYNIAARNAELEGKGRAAPYCSIGLIVATEKASI